MIGPRRKTPSAAIADASIHTTVLTRFTGTPSSAARSAFSADARTAIPTSVSRKNSVSPTTTPTTAKTITRWLALNTKPLTVALSDENGVRGGAGSTMLPVTKYGSASWMPANTSPTPIVATDRMSLGAFEKRRTTKYSTSIPETTAVLSVMSSAAR